MGGFAHVSEDVLRHILTRLPALSFASAACVSKCWHRVCSGILSRPKLASALSLNPSLLFAIEEVLDRVLSEPIRPQFAIAFVGLQFSLELTHKIITERLGSTTPVITNAASGIIGVDTISHEIKEVKWDSDDEDSYSQGFDTSTSINRGIVLVVGNLPGLKVDAIPLLRSKKEPAFIRVDKFMMDVEDYTASVSGSNTAPAGIIFFGDQLVDMKPILAEIDSAIPEETVIVGDACAQFLCRSGDYCRKYAVDQYFFDAVALVLAKEKDKHHAVGETHLHVTMSTGMQPFGPELQAVSVTLRGGSDCSWLTARMEGYDDILDGQGLLEEISEQIDDESPDLYIGVIQKIPCPPGPQRSAPKTYIAFYEVLRGEEEYFVIDGIGVQPGDTFLFYHSDTDTATSSCVDASENLSILKKPATGSNNCLIMKDVAARNEVFGGLIFSCSSRGESFFGRRNVDTYPFCNNFPGAPLAGMFCAAEIGRGLKSTSDMEQEFEQETSARCPVHVYSTVYLVLSYVPPTYEHC